MNARERLQGVLDYYSFLFVNDLLSCIGQDNTVTYYYADDVKLFAPVNNFIDCSSSEKNLPEIDSGTTRIRDARYLKK